MNILISNDDGIAASGIKALISVLSKNHNVYVIAPDRERSAAGHSLTLHTPLRVEELESKFGAKRVWITTGTPGDCVKIGISAILEANEKPDIVISGINHGPNLGTDILYSGTVSCAMEGAMMGVPSIAVSLASMMPSDEDFVTTAKFIDKLLPRLENFNFPKKTILNVNTPALDENDIAGVEITKLGTKMFTDAYEKRIDPRGKVYYWMAGELTKEHEEDGTDISALRANRISITPITFEMTHKSIISELEDAFCPGGICSWFGYDANN
ncbi:MAG: 5'/3'-nucleotidase SurE [Cyanobacteria bacterium SIG30]|nr:5'/3'-nucleotidase SurE [Cyanobacteria bacterium SIG30]